MSLQKIVVDTDIIVEHLIHEEGASLLRNAMNMFFCYTTVFNAIEAFSIARSEKEIEAIDGAMSAMKILGLNAKSAKGIGKSLSDIESTKRNSSAALIAGVCIESKLPIITMNPKRFTRVKQLRVIPAQRLVRYRTAAEILS